jgi:hypothetical protein
MDMSQQIDTYCRAWTEPDAAQRAQYLQAVWADGGRYVDPTVDLVGADALLEHIAAMHTRRPGARVKRTSALDCHHDACRFEWEALSADGTALVKGIDLALLDATGRIKAVIGFFGTLQPRAEG